MLALLDGGCSCRCSHGEASAFHRRDGGRGERYTQAEIGTRELPALLLHQKISASTGAHRCPCPATEPILGGAAIRLGRAGEHRAART